MTKQLTAVAREQGRLMGDHYRNAMAAKAEGRPVIYVSAMFPVEIARAFEPHAAIVYPENHAVLMITRGQQQLVKRAEAAGLDRMGCAYELINTGYHLDGHGRLDAEDLRDAKGRALPRLPEPDIVLACDNQCRLICEWFRNLSEISGNKPYRMINVGDRLDGVMDRSRIDYVKGQLEDLIAFLEAHIGVRLDRDRLLEVADTSRQAIELWQRYLDLGTRRPSPVTVFDGFFHMAMIVSERGNPHAVEYYRQLLDAMEEVEKSGAYPVARERHRLLWDNLPTWFNFREIQNTCADNGLAVVGSVYLQGWLKALDASGYDALLESMAVSYGTLYTNFTIPERIAFYIGMAEKYGVDGVLFHKNLSCHTVSLRVHEIADALCRHFGPEFRTVVFEGCQGIPGRFQKHAFETGMNVHFIER